MASVRCCPTWSGAEPDSAGYPGPMDHAPHRSGLVVGLDAASIGSRRGWALVAIRVAPGRTGPVVGLAFTRDLAPLVAGRVPELPELDGARLLAVGIDIPVGLVATGLRAADVEGRRALGSRASTLFPIAPRAVVEEPDYDRAKALAQERTGRKISRQSHGLRKRILEVDELLRSAPPGAASWFEVHPELSFAALGGEVVEAPKKTDAGRVRREELLAGVGLLPAIAGEVGACSELAGRLAPDDLLDAAVVAWSAARARTGEARRFGRGALQRDPELDREILIHA